MKTIFFTRHGQTVWNVENKICGSTESALTETGIIQAQQLGEYLRNHQIKIDQILCSPLSRAKDTAEIISNLTNIPVKTDPRLREQNFGKWEGTSPRNALEFQEDKKCFINRYETGESMLMTASRVYNLLDEIRLDTSKKVYLLVAHNGIARMVESYFHDMTNEEFAAFGIRNCELREYHFPISEL